MVPIHWVSGKRCKQIGMHETKRDCGGRTNRHVMTVSCGPPICFSSGPVPSGQSNVSVLRERVLPPGSQPRTQRFQIRLLSPQHEWHWRWLLRGISHRPQPRSQASQAMEPHPHPNTSSDSSVADGTAAGSPSLWPNGSRSTDVAPLTTGAWSACRYGCVPFVSRIGRIRSSRPTKVRSAVQSDWARSAPARMAPGCGCHP
jgi:hypothetical protein